MAWEDKYYRISALNRLGTQELCYDLMEFIEQLPREIEIEEEKQEKVEFKWDDYHAEQVKRHQKDDDDDDDDWEDWNEDDYDGEIIYKP